MLVGLWLMLQARHEVALHLHIHILLLLLVLSCLLAAESAAFRCLA
jgi:hypothetical protein